jgi:hypothetical protein
VGTMLAGEVVFTLVLEHPPSEQPSQFFVAVSLERAGLVVMGTTCAMGAGVYSRVQEVEILGRDGVGETVWLPKSITVFCFICKLKEASRWLDGYTVPS